MQIPFAPPRNGWHRALMNTDIPITRHPVAAAKAASIRAAIRKAVTLPALDATARVATVADASAFHAFLSDPAIHAPIFTLPSPLTQESVAAFIKDHNAEQAAGEGLLLLHIDAAGSIVGYSDIEVWPHWAAGKMGGAVHPARQGGGHGTKLAALGFGWMFDTLGLELICETGAIDNVRTAGLLTTLGFSERGEITSRRPDGSTRPSKVWELSKADWRARRAGN